MNDITVLGHCVHVQTHQTAVLQLGSLTGYCLPTYSVIDQNPLAWHVTDVWWAWAWGSQEASSSLGDRTRAGSTQTVVPTLKVPTPTVHDLFHFRFPSAKEDVFALEQVIEMQGGSSLVLNCFLISPKLPGSCG